jgi:hypothetical protein
VVNPARTKGAEGGDGEGDTLADRPGNETDRADAGGTSGIEEADLGVGGVQGASSKEDELGAGGRLDEVNQGHHDRDGAQHGVGPHMGQALPHVGEQGSDR